MTIAALILYTLAALVALSGVQSHLDAQAARYVDGNRHAAKVVARNNAIVATLLLVIAATCLLVYPAVLS